ncbi:hypothetical protein MVEN_01588600 [Mycena venus]|uniref:Uncharacterized protein n=1 Tax=Mycena venus TaxID=2733690 RepID=A0A8H7CSC1_9AGAR|nr:hypothetical protein MVEN_01588600 [Mycena venus]
MAIILPNLHRLEIADPSEWGKPIDRGDFLDRLTASALEELVGCYGSDSIRMFVHRSSSALTRLSLYCCYVDYELARLLRDIPTLTHLLLQEDFDRRGVPNFNNNSNHFFEAMKISSDSVNFPTPTCPNLISLFYGYDANREDEFAFSEKAFLDMAVSRHKTLKFIRVFPSTRLYDWPDWPVRPGAKIEPFLESLREMGVDAAFWDYGKWSKSQAERGLTF